MSPYHIVKHRKIAPHSYVTVLEGGIGDMFRGGEIKVSWGWTGWKAKATKIKVMNRPGAFEHDIFHSIALRETMDIEEQLTEEMLHDPKLAA
jgi:hypothetical protein